MTQWIKNNSDLNELTCTLNIVSLVDGSPLAMGTPLVGWLKIRVGASVSAAGGVATWVRDGVVSYKGLQAESNVDCNEIEFTANDPSTSPAPHPYYAQTLVTIVDPTDMVTALMAYVLRTGVINHTVRGFLRRMDALFWGKVTGLIGAAVTAYQPDGVTAEVTATQDVSAGNRDAADVTTSEGP